MARRLLHVFELRAVFQRRGDEGRAHRMRGVARAQAELAAYLRTTRSMASGCIARRAWPACHCDAAGGTAARRCRRRGRRVEIGAQPRGGLRVDGERVAPPALADDAQRIEAAVLVQVADVSAAISARRRPDLQADRQDGAVAQALRCVSLRRRVKQLARLRLGESQRGSFVAVDRRPLDFARPGSSRHGRAAPGA